MTAIIVIDEAGDLGHAGSKNLTMTAVVSESTRNLRPLLKFVKSSNGEKKFSKCNDGERIQVSEAISIAELKVVFYNINKNKISRKKLFGSKLYRLALTELIERSLEELEHVDVHIIVDSSYFIRQEEFETMCDELCYKHGKHLMKCYKGISQNDSCIRIADFAAGMVWRYYEYSDKAYYTIIEKRVIDARK